MSPRILALATLVLALTAPRGSAAQAPIPIRVGDTVESELTGSSPRLDELPFQSYRIDARAGERLRITLTSAEFEPHLGVGREVGGVTEYLLAGGYHGLGRRAVLDFAPPASGSYLILAHSSSDDIGRYTLTVDRATSSAAAPLLVSEVVSGVLETEALHSFDATAGVEVRITLRSRDFDSMLEIGRNASGTFEPILSDDDGAGVTDSRIYFLPPETSRYVARVTEYGGGGGGGYAILLDLPPALPEPVRLSTDSEATGELGDSDPVADDGFIFDDWTLEANAGARFRIDLTSDDFDAYLSVGRSSGRSFEELTANDDAGVAELGATDARVVLVAPEAGVYTVRVRGFTEQDRGSYTLLAASLATARAEPEGGTLRLEQRTTGELTETDAVLADGSAYEEWRFTIAAGQRVELTAASEAFDTYLLVGTGTAANFRELAENDDWAGSANGTDSRLTFTATESREYVARVRAFAADGFGSYTLTAVEAPPIRSSPFAGRLEPGRTVGASLEEIDARMPDDAPFHHWFFRADAGRTVVVDLNSAEFDTYLSLGRISGGEYLELSENDDFADGTDSRITFVVPETGEYVLRVRAYSPEERGRYSLTLSTR